MPTSAQVPYHLVVGARTGFLTGLQVGQPMWQRIAQQINLSARSTDLVDLGTVPMPTHSNSGKTVQDFIERHMAVVPLDWDVTVHISKNAIADDQTGTLEARARSAGERFNQHMSKLCFAALNAGDATTYGLCYDGLYMFSNSHLDKGAAYQTVQDNMFALTLNLTNFNTVWTAAMNFKDDHGEPAYYNYDLLVVPPALKLAAAQITDNVEDATTGNRAINPFNGDVRHIVSQDLDATAWFLVASNHPVKPLLLVMRKMPSLDPEDISFDKDKPDGGHWEFKFTARYNVYYGDWRLAIMGLT